MFILEDDIRSSIKMFVCAKYDCCHQSIKQDIIMKGITMKYRLWKDIKSRARKLVITKVTYINTMDKEVFKSYKG